MTSSGAGSVPTSKLPAQPRGIRAVALDRALGMLADHFGLCGGCHVHTGRRPGHDPRHRFDHDIAMALAADEYPRFAATLSGLAESTSSPATRSASTST